MFKFDVGKLKWLELVGEKGEVVKRVIERENKYVCVLIVKFGSFVIYDYCCDRVWVWVNDVGIVVSIFYVG